MRAGVRGWGLGGGNMRALIIKAGPLVYTLGFRAYCSSVQGLHGDTTPS